MTPTASPPSVDPVLYDPDDRDFSLASASPCIDAGVNVGLTADFSGTPAPQGEAYDMGAHEYCQADPVRILSRDFTTFQAAYASAAANARILGRRAILDQGLASNRDIPVTLVGGFNCDFSGHIGSTTMAGALEISAGAVTVEGIVLQ